MRAPRILPAALVSMLALASCGGNGTSYSGATPESWASEVCDALNDWGPTPQLEARALEAMRTARDLKTIKARFIAVMKQAEASASEMVARVKAVGPPAVKDGTAFQREVEGVLQRAQDTFTRAIATARALPTTDPQAFSSGMLTLGLTFKTELAAGSKDLKRLDDKYRDTALKEAISRQPDCIEFG